MMDRETVFVADDHGPPLRRMWIYSDAPGWSFVVSEWDANGDERPYRDSWEATFEEIKRYPAEYARAPLIWRIEGANDRVDVMALTDAHFSPSRA
jgi:hypothetical protein